MPASSVPSPAGNLPAELTSFVGRRREVADVKDMLSEARLVTLTGVGGAGKTRLSLRVAAGLRRVFRDGVWFVELASLEDPDLLTQTVSTTLGIWDRTTRHSLATLADYLRDKHLLLVLDNCEHLRDSCAVLAETLLRTAPELRVLTTSRQALGLTGEHIFHVPTLSVPGAGKPPPLDALGQYEAIRLFTDRAAAVRPGFTLTEENHATVARICRQLEGIPLAIELTAVRLRALSVEDILERLEDRYRLLTTGSPGALPRHQTLRALIDWSHGLCSEPEQALWARLSVFSGSFDLRAAEEICSGGELERHAVFDLITGLVEKSIVTAEGHAGSVRYRMLETIRQYGQNRLRESGSENLYRRRHRDYFTHLVRRAWSAWFGGEQKEWLTLLQAEHSNFRAALEFTFGERESPERGLWLAGGLWFFWIASGRVGEGRHWLDRGLQLHTRSSSARATALWVNSYLCLIQEDAAAARPMITECAEHAERLDDSGAQAWATQLSGMASLSEGDLSTALTELEAARDEHHAGGDTLGFLDDHFFLVIAAALLDDHHRAVRLCEEALALCDAHDERWLKSYMLWALGLVAWELDDVRRAAASVRDSLRLAHVFDEQWAIGFCLEVLAWTAHATHQEERAARLLGGADGIWQRIGAPLFGMRHLIRYHDRCVAGVRDALGEAGFKTAFSRGFQFGLAEVVADALEQREPAPHQRAETDTDAPLTPREHQVAGLVAQGLINREIAASLVIAPRTAEAHVEHIRTKLGFSSRAQIAAWVVERQSS